MVYCIVVNLRNMKLINLKFIKFGSVETLSKSTSLAGNVCYGLIYTDTFHKNANFISSSNSKNDMEMVPACVAIDNWYLNVYSQLLYLLSYFLFFLPANY